MSTATITALEQEKNDNGATNRENNGKLSDTSLVGGFKWNDVLVPSVAGTGEVVWHYQKRTIAQYACLVSAGLYIFYRSDDPRIRAAGLGLLFPGAGLVAVCSVTSLVGFMFSTALIPLVMFAWFGCGGITFPIVLWTGTDLLGAFLAKDSVLEVAGPIWTAVCVMGVVYLTWKTKEAKQNGREKRDVRNAYLIDAVQQNQLNAVLPEPGSREVDEVTLRFLQWILELGLSPKDDFSYHDVIDQFQTAALRYQLYEAVNDLGLYQNIFAPNFHGYLSQAQRNIIEKSLQKKVVGFWKWESILGKFKFQDWDPIKKDNIMVSGYVLQMIGIYQTNTRDDRYTKKDSLEFEITDTARYKYDLPSIAAAVFRNMEESPYCLYPCEPNWIYTLCNLVGISGIVATDRLLGNNYGERLKKRFESALEKEFSFTNGSILPICSELTGFTIPGLAGALSDALNSMLCAAYLPHIAHRNWAFTKKENIRYNDKGRLECINLTGADKLDPGNYRPGEGAIRALFAMAAAEFGDEKLRVDLLKQLDEEYHPVFTTRTGALKNKGLSTIEQGAALRARMGRFQDWCRMIQRGPPEQVFKGPILDSVPFPEVLVAKAYSRDGESVDLVLYNGQKPGTFALQFTRAKAGATYKLADQRRQAGEDGTVTFEMAIDGRTAVVLELEK